MNLEEYRSQKDAFLASARSPLPAPLRANFLGLTYYPENPALRFTGLALEPDAARQTVTMQTSSGAQRAYQRLGWLRFVVNNQQCRLAVYALETDTAPETAFVPFRDLTSGQQTYAGGRYVDASLADGLASLDFNLAYNPYCAYAEGWSCAVPPPENRLAVAIEAGELRYEAAHD